MRPEAKKSKQTFNRSRAEGGAPKPPPHSAIKAESRLGEDRFRMAVEAAPNAMIMIDREGKTVLVNSQTEQVFGYKRSELIGREIEMLIPARYRGAHPGHRDAFFSGPKTRSMGAGRDLFGLRKDATEVPVEIGLNPMQTSEGPFVLASIIDITERRAIEKKLARSEVLAAIGGMVTVVAHEIRNPLGSIVMGAKALARGDLNPQEHEQVTSVLLNESVRLNRTLEDFLSFARPREPKKELADLNAVVHEVLSAMRSDSQLVGSATIAEKLDKHLPKVSFDADLIRQVLWNIIRNGFQALGGKGKLEIQTEAGSGEIAIHVKDTGPGIPAERLEKIFVPFYTTKRSGTGLGLSTSRTIVQAHGGDIQIESAPGLGSRFSVILPLPS